MESISGDTTEIMHEVCFTILAIGNLQPDISIQGNGNKTSK